MAENLVVNLTVDNIRRLSLNKETNKKVVIPFTEFRVFDDFSSLLPNAAAGDDLGLVMGTFGSASPSIQTLDFGGTSTTSYARVIYQIPLEWVSTLKVRIHAGMLTTVSDGTATFDMEAYESDGEAGIGSDLCQTAAVDVNSLTLADFDFTIDTAGIAVGDWLDMRLTFSGSDTGDLGVMQGICGEFAMIMDVRG